jgi:HSP20 family molecular chaperone IbpA
MSKHLVVTKKAGDPASEGLFQSIDAAMESIRRRAYELFHARGGAPASDLDDWFKAERELFEVPPGEMGETANAFVVKVATPGFTADQLDVAVDAALDKVRAKTYLTHHELSRNL